MTPLEKKATQQKNANVIEAGRSAYKMLILLPGNPHSKQPYRDLWDKGWRLERRKEENKRFPGKKPFVKAPAPAATGTPAAPKRTFVKPEFTRPVRHDNRPVRTAPKPIPAQPAVITDRLINRFNSRHQTRA